jgi:hypothetical protein
VSDHPILTDVALCNTMRSELADHMDLDTDPRTAEDYEKLKRDLELWIELAGDLLHELTRTQDAVVGHEADFVADLREEATRADELYMCPNHQFTGDRS